MQTGSLESRILGVGGAQAVSLNPYSPGSRPSGCEKGTVQRALAWEPGALVLVLTLTLKNPCCGILESSIPFLGVDLSGF